MTSNRRIEAALARAGAEHQPPAGWQGRVLAAVATPPPPRWHRFVGPMGFVVIAMIAVLAVFWVVGAL